VGADRAFTLALEELFQPVCLTPKACQALKRCDRRPVGADRAFTLALEELF